MGSRGRRGVGVGFERSRSETKVEAEEEYRGSRVLYWAEYMLSNVAVDWA